MPPGATKTDFYFFLHQTRSNQTLYYSTAMEPLESLPRQSEHIRVLCSSCHANYNSPTLKSELLQHPECEISHIPLSAYSRHKSLLSSYVHLSTNSRTAATILLPPLLDSVSICNVVTVLWIPCALYYVMSFERTTLVSCQVQLKAKSQLQCFISYVSLCVL